MAGYKGWMAEMLAVRAEIAGEEAAALRKLAMAKAANAAGFKARAAAAKAMSRAAARVHIAAANEAAFANGFAA